MVESGSLRGDVTAGELCLHLDEPKFRVGRPERRELEVDSGNLGGHGSGGGRRVDNSSCIWRRSFVFTLGHSAELF